MKCLGTILFPLFCLFASLTILLTDPAFTTTLLENKEAIEPTKQLIQHFYGSAEIPEVFNEAENSHLEDVTELIRMAGLALIALFILYAFTRQEHYIYITTRGTILLAAILVFLYFVPFDVLFTKFHEILFLHGNWQFASNSTLITYYPDTFFAKYGAAIGLHTLLIGLTLTYFSRMSTTQ